MVSLKVNALIISLKFWRYNCVILMFYHLVKVLGDFFSGLSKIVNLFYKGIFFLLYRVVDMCVL